MQIACRILGAGTMGAQKIHLRARSRSKECAFLGPWLAISRMERERRSGTSDADDLRGKRQPGSDCRTHKRSLLPMGFRCSERGAHDETLVRRSVTLCLIDSPQLPAVSCKKRALMAMLAHRLSTEVQQSRGLLYLRPAGPRATDLHSSRILVPGSCTQSCCPEDGHKKQQA